MNTPRLDRRGFLRTTGGAALATPFMGLYSREALADGRIEPVPSPYGPVAPVADRTTGLYLLQLPEGFSYQSFGWAGDPMANGKPTPLEHDGMAVTRARLVNGEPEFTLIRNHESKVLREVGLIENAPAYDTADVTEDDVTGKLSGGTTALVYRGGAWIETRPTLAGTIDNCAGGPTTWNTWLTCEEDLADYTAEGGKKHGYVFEVSDIEGQTSGIPIIAMGRMEHEAVAMDPRSGAIYLTEDSDNQAGLYKFVPANTDRAVGALEQGGTLYMAKAVGADNLDLLDPAMGQTLQVEWVEIAEPDMDPQPFAEAPLAADNLCSGPFWQGREQGALRFSRLEGCWYSAADRLVYLVDTQAGVGDDEDNPGYTGPGFGEGAVWTLDPASDTLSCLYKSESALAGNNFDNVTVSPRGGVLLCEDGGGVEDGFGPGERLLGLTPEGETYIFAKYNVQLEPADIKAAGKSEIFIQPDDYREDEWAGATFDPSGRILFVNAQTPGITFAITGPWERGLL